MFFDNTFNQIINNNQIDSNLLNVYANIKNIINLLFKNNWTNWIYIAYFIGLIILAYIIVKIKCIYTSSFKFDKYFKLTNNISIITIPIAFSSFLITILLNYESFFVRIGILFLIICLFLIFSIIIYAIFKNYKNNSKLIHFNSGVITPIIFVIYLAISNDKLFISNILANINFWFALIIGSFINGILHFSKNQNTTFSKYNLSYLTPIVVSGINTSPLTYIGDIVELSYKLHNKISLY